MTAPLPPDRRPARRAVALAVLAALHGLAWAQDNAQDNAQNNGQADAAPAADPADASPPATRSPVQIETAVIGAKRLTAADAAKRELDAVPGGTSQVRAEDVERRRVATNEDVLAFQPGVFAQSSGGSDGIKISIRGSAINRGANFFRSGILFLFDGLPVTGPGGTPYELFEPLGLSRTDILRGPNAADLGAATLGGAINYVTKTGREAAPFEVRLEGGSFGYRKLQLASGQVFGQDGQWDYYVSATSSHRDGYQKLTQADTAGINANLGWRISPTVQTRFFVRHRKTENEVPGNLTAAEIERDPQQANAVNVGFGDYGSRRLQPGSTFIGNKTTLQLDDASQLELGLVWHDYPINIQSTIYEAVWGYTDISATLRYTRRDELFGRDSRTTIGLLNTQHTTEGWQRTYIRVPSATGPRANLPAGTLVRDARYNGADRVIHASNELQTGERWWLTTGLSAINVERSTEVVYPQTNQPYDRSDWAWAPRLGLRWQATPRVQVFGNLSRSVEPPNDWALLTTPPAFPSSSPAAGLAVRGLDLKDQTATTFELGTRGQAGAHTWSLSAYHALVKNELLSVEVQRNPSVTAESNASATYHRGIEAGLESLLWQSSRAHKVSLRQAYTLNDFRFRDDARFGSNQLPGIPRHVYQGEVEYEHPSGFYANLNVQYASKAWADYANSYAAPSYALLGATLGINRPREGWSAYLDLRNLTDKHYVAVISPIFDVAGVEANRQRFTPGDGFGVYAGVAFSFK